MVSQQTMALLRGVLASFPDVTAVYLFGSYPERGKQARDIDLAVLVQPPAGSPVDLYMALYPALAGVFAPLEVDLLFLTSCSLSVCFEAIAGGTVVYCVDDNRRADFEEGISRKYMDFRYHLMAGQQELFDLIRGQRSVV